MSNLSEEELVILQNIQYALDNVGSIDYGDFNFDDIQGLLDLYNKEKEKNNKYEQMILEHKRQLKKSGIYGYDYDLKILEETNE